MTKPPKTKHGMILTSHGTMSQSFWYKETKAIMVNLKAPLTKRNNLSKMKWLPCKQ